MITTSRTNLTLQNTDAALQELRSQLRSQGSDEKRIRELEGALMALQMVGYTCWSS